MPRIRGNGSAHLWNQRIALGALPNNNVPLELFYKDGGLPVTSDSSLPVIEQNYKNKKCLTWIFYNYLYMDIQFISCACGCGELIPAINKLGKPAKFKHGHNVKDGFYNFNDPKRIGKIVASKKGIPRPDMRGNQYRKGIKPTNAIKKGQHISPKTEYKKNHINLPENRLIVSKTLKTLWKEKNYRKRFIKGPRAKKTKTSIENRVNGIVERLGYKAIRNKWFRFATIPGKKHGCQPDLRIEKLKTIIFCDSTYWHKGKAKKRKDLKIDLELGKRGYKVIRLNEEQIKYLNPETLAEMLQINYKPENLQP